MAIMGNMNLINVHFWTYLNWIEPKWPSLTEVNSGLEKKKKPIRSSRESIFL